MAQPLGHHGYRDRTREAFSLKVFRFMIKFLLDPKCEVQNTTLSTMAQFSILLWVHYKFNTRYLASLQKLQAVNNTSKPAANYLVSVWLKIKVNKNGVQYRADRTFMLPSANRGVI